MSESRHGRRRFLTAATSVGVGIASLGRAGATETNNLDNACSRDVGGEDSSPDESSNESSKRGSEDTTEPEQERSSSEPSKPASSVAVTVSDSGTPGPTVFIVGGLHGDEKAGIIAAHQIAQWTPDAGKLVVLPEANPVAITHDARGTERGNLNRKFVAGGPPETKLARTIWQKVTAADPDILLTLHESAGIYHGSPSGVGQAVFRSPGDDTDEAAEMGIRRANQTIGSRELRFAIGPISSPEIPPTGLLTEKAAYEAGIPSFIVETYESVNEEARVQWQKEITRGVLDYYDLYS